MRIFCLILLGISCCFFYISCKSKSNSKEVDQKEINDTSFYDEIYFNSKVDLDSIMRNNSAGSGEMNGDVIFTRRLKKLKDSLSLNIVPEFIENACLDTENMSYCMVNLHKYRSLRKDLIDSLPSQMIAQLVYLGDSVSLKKTCMDTRLIDILPYFEQSTWELLKKWRSL